MHGISARMSDSALDQLSDQFQHNSSTFLEWFTAEDNTRLNSKLELADLRDSGAGRGVGKHLSSCRRKPLLISPC
jgi:hypothetical protein